MFLNIEISEEPHMALGTANICCTLHKIPQDSTTSSCSLRLDVSLFDKRTGLLKFFS